MMSKVLISKYLYTHLNLDFFICETLYSQKLSLLRDILARILDHISLISNVMWSKSIAVLLALSCTLHNVHGLSEFTQTWDPYNQSVQKTGDFYY